MESPCDGDGVLNDPLARRSKFLVTGRTAVYLHWSERVRTLRVVVYAFRGDDARFISVRKAEPKEIRGYEKEYDFSRAKRGAVLRPMARHALPSTWTML